MANYTKISITAGAQAALRRAVRQLSAALDRDMTLSETIEYLSELAERFPPATRPADARPSAHDAAGGTGEQRA